MLYECLTGKQAFEGETVSDLIAKILEREPDWTLLPAATPTRVRELLPRCLTKDARQRLRDIGEARVLLGSGGSAPPALGEGQRGAVLHRRHRPHATRSRQLETRAMIRPFAFVLLAAALAIGAGPAAAASPLRGLDHVVVAVADLDSAAQRYRDLGFALKRGQPHDDGIRNQHVKFRDGTEIELLTAPEARDSLTEQYRRHLAAGDGPAFYALYVSEPDVLARWLKAGGYRYLRDGNLITFPVAHALRPVFFGGRNRSITDQPAHFAHPNTAEDLLAVWLAGEGAAADRALLVALGARASARMLLPDSVRAEVLSAGDGEVYLLPAAWQSVPGRKIVGATVRVRSVAKAREVLARGGLTGLHEAQSERGRSLFLPPAVTHGIWLELLEQK